MASLPKNTHLLLEMLQQQPRLHGYTVKAVASNCIVVYRGGRMRGVWVLGEHGFDWTPACCKEATSRGLSVEDALTHTLALLTV